MANDVIDRWTPSALRFWRVTAVYLRYATRPAMARGVPIYVNVLLLGYLAQQVIPLHQILSLRSPLLPAAAVVWCALSSPVRAALFKAENTILFLRSLPIGRTTVAGTVFVSLMCVDLPWLLLCFCSDDPRVWACGPLLTAALHAAIASRRPTFLVSIGTLLVVAPKAPAWFVAAASLLVVSYAAPIAWTASHAGRVKRWRGLHVKSPWLGIARTMLSTMGQTATQYWIRILSLSALLVAMAIFAIRNNDLDTFSGTVTVSVIVLSMGQPWVFSELAIRVLTTGWSLAWLYDSTGTTNHARWMGGLAAMAGVGFAFGAGYGLVVALLESSPGAVPVLLHVLLLGVVGAAIAVVVLGVAAATTMSSVEVDRSKLTTVFVSSTVLSPFLIIQGPRPVVITGVLLVAASALVHGTRGVASIRP